VFRSEGFLAFVRQQPCVAPTCLRLADHTHHFGRSGAGGGTGLKPHDSYTVPLCALHHLHVHDFGDLPPLTTDQTESLFYSAALHLLTEWLELEKPARRRIRTCKKIVRVSR
jgi:hypothetical protein